MNKKELQINFLKKRLRLSLDLDKSTQRHVYQTALEGDVFEKETAHVMSKLVREGDTVLDIGAHIGIVSMYLAVMVGDRGRVYAFEPEPGNFVQLKETVSANGFDNILCYKIALHSRSGQSTFYINSDNDGGHALWDVGLHPVNRGSRDNPVSVTVENQTLDRIMKQLRIPPPRLLKIDTEGLEFHILNGGQNAILIQRVPYIIAEMNIFGMNVMGVDEMQLRNFMAEYGYDTYAILAGHRHPVPLPEEPVFGEGTDNNVLFAHRDAMIGGVFN
jgi:FkbM family methyltransferase